MIMMRKLLMTLMATAICTLVTTSCVKGPDDIPPTPPSPTPEPTPEEKYDAAFLNYVGGTISPNQDWGFNAGVIATRGMTRGAEEGYYIDYDYDMIYTKSFYDAIFERLPEDQTKKMADDVQKNFEFQDHGTLRFQIIYSCISKDVEIGYYHYSKDQKLAYRKEIVLDKAFYKDQPEIAYFQYSKDYNNWSTPTADMGYKMFSEQKAMYVHSKMISLRDGSEPEDPVDVPVGDLVGFYVKIGDKKYYTNRYLNENDEDKYFAVINEDSDTFSGAYVVGIEALDNDTDCNDIIIVVNRIEDGHATITFPEKPVEPTWRVIGEDLSAEENSDFDFNDIVLDVTLTEEGADCVLQAAGGQLPLRINYDDNLEVHKLFGVDQKKMVNTINLVKHPELEPYKVDKDPVKFSIKGPFSSVYDVMIQVKKDDGKWHPLYARPGESACKILVDPSFVWLDELESLKVVYPKFIDYVNDPTKQWYP